MDAGAARAAARRSASRCAEWLRAIGLSFGLPAVYNPDEVAIMSRALGFAKGDLNPHNFLYPTFYFYVLFAWVGGYFAVSWADRRGGVARRRSRRSSSSIRSGIYHAGRDARRRLRRGHGVADVHRSARGVAGWRAGAGRRAVPGGRADCTCATRTT